MTRCALGFAVLLTALSACARPAPQSAAPGSAAQATPSDGGQSPYRISLPAMSDEERDQLAAKSPVNQIGIHRKLGVGVVEAGAAATSAAGEPEGWTEEDDGPVWRVVVESPGAVALRVHFDQMQFGGGVLQVWEWREGKPGRQGLELSGEFKGEAWSRMLQGDAALVEYRPAAGAPGGGPVPFRMDRVSHLWKLP